MARAPISVIIPTLNAREGLATCLGSLGEGLSAGLIREVIVSDGGSTDGTCELAEQAGAEVVSGVASRGGQLRRGCDVAQGDWLLVVHADTILTEGWAQQVLQHLAGETDKAAYFKLAFRAKGVAPWMVAGWANRRSKLLGLPYGDQGLLIPRNLYDGIGGYEDIPLMEDVAIVRRLKGRLTDLSAVITTSAERYERDGWLRRSLRNFVTLMRYYAGSDPADLVSGYSKRS